MKCRMCGYEFDENEIPNRGCSGCGKHGCHSVHCPNCGFGNSPELDQEFDFIIKIDHHPFIEKYANIQENEEKNSNIIDDIYTKSVSYTHLRAHET